MLQRNITFAGFVVAEIEMPLRERTARGIFTAQPNGRAFEHQRTEGQSLREAPIDRAAAQRFAPPFDDVLQLGMQLKVIRQRGALLDYLRQRVIAGRCRRNRLIHLFGRRLGEVLNHELLRGAAWPARSSRSGGCAIARESRPHGPW